MRIVWTPEAERDRLDIWLYLNERDPAAAARIDQLFSYGVGRLSDFPMLGHEGMIAGTRELSPHRNYRLVYEVADDMSGY